MPPSIVKPLTTKDLSEMTGFSMDYFQKLARAGKIPCQRLGYGSRAMFLFDSAEFEQWWKSNLRKVEPCREVRSASGGRSTGRGSGSKGKTTKSPLAQKVDQLLVSGLAAMSKS